MGSLDREGHRCNIGFKFLGLYIWGRKQIFESFKRLNPFSYGFRNIQNSQEDVRTSRNRLNNVYRNLVHELTQLPD